MEGYKSIKNAKEDVTAPLLLSSHGCRSCSHSNSACHYCVCLWHYQVDKICPRMFRQTWSSGIVSTHSHPQTHVQTNAESSTGHSVAASNFVIAGCACLLRCLQSFWLKRPLLALSGFSIAFDSCILVYSCEIWILVLIQFFLYFCVFFGGFLAPVWISLLLCFRNANHILASRHPRLRSHCR